MVLSFEVKGSRPSLSSCWIAELEDLSLLEGRELAATELAACSCIFLLYPIPNTRRSLLCFQEFLKESRGKERREFSLMLLPVYHQPALYLLDLVYATWAGWSDFIERQRQTLSWKKRRLGSGWNQRTGDEKRGRMKNVRLNSIGRMKTKRTFNNAPSSGRQKVGWIAENRRTTPQECNTG